MQGHPCVLLKLLANLARHVENQLRLAIDWQVKFVDEYFGELIRGGQGLVQIPEKRVLQSVRWGDVGLSVGGQSLVDAELACIRGCRKWCIWSEGLYVHVYPYGNQGDWENRLHLDLLLRPRPS